MCYAQPGFNQILESHLFVEASAARPLVQTFSKKIQINSFEERHFGQLAILLEAGDEFTLLHAHATGKASGKVLRKIKQNQVTYSNLVDAEHLAQDRLVARFDLIANEYPYIIEFSYTIKSRNYLFLANWSPTDFGEASCQKASLTLSALNEVKFNTRLTGNFAYSVNPEKGKTTHTWTYQPIETPAPSYQVTNSSLPVDRIILIPEQFHYGVYGSQQTWVDFGNWFLDLNRGVDQLPEAEREFIQEIRSTHKSPYEIIQAVYKHVQEKTRYVLITLDVGGFKSSDASYVSSNKYGDCKALCTYTKSLLHACGVDSYFTLVYAGTQPKSLLDTLPHHQFNHVILAIPLQADTVFLECTSKHNEAGYLGTFTQNRKVLFVKRDSSKPIWLPALDSVDVHCRSEVKITPQNDAWKIHVKKELRGAYFEYYAYHFKNSNINSLRAQFIHPELPGNSCLSELPEDLSYHISTKNTIDIEADISCSNLLEKKGTFRVLGISVVSEQLKHASKLIDTYSQLPYPIAWQQSTILEIDPAQFSNIPESIHFSNNLGRYSMEVIPDEQKLLLREQLFLSCPSHSKTCEEDLNELVQKIEQYANQAKILIQ